MSAATGLPSAHDESLLGRLAHVSEPADGRTSRPIRIALALLALFELLYLVETWQFETRLLRIAAYFICFDIALAAAAFGTTYTRWFERHWRAMTLAVCLCVIVSRTMMGIAMDEDEPVLLMLFALVLGTAMLVPWSLRWELWVMGAGLLSFTVASFVGAMDLDDFPRWLILGATMAIAANFMSLKKYYLAQASLIETLKATRTRLSAEVAERHAAEMVARSHEIALRKTMEASLDAMTIKRVRDDVYLEVNEEFARMTGYSREQLMGRSATALRIWKDPAAYRAFYSEVKARGEMRNHEVAIRTAEGTVVEGLVSARMVDLDGEQCVVATTRDITERKALEKELVAAREAARAASRAKSEFLSSTSHEIRTPMNAILGMADLLAEDPALTAEERRYVETMRSNGNALLHLINDILDLAKIESGKLSLEAIGFDLEEVVERTLQTMGVRAHGKGLELTGRIMPDVPHSLVGDPLRLGQILINLIGNAIKFTEEGEVVLSVETLPGSANDGGDSVGLRFSISDTGIGIPADKLATIFSGFSQADASITRRFGGSGLGLTIVSRLTKLMSGTVDVKSEIGRGSTFSFTAVLQSDPQPATTISREVARLDGVRVLIVDDNATNRLILREMLAKERAQTSEASSGEAALAELERARTVGNPYRVMLLDYRMPGMDGAEVARRVLSERRNRTPDSATAPDQTMILMLTSEDLNVQLAKLREMGLQTYLIKPIRRTELLEAIGRLLATNAAVPAPAGQTQSTTQAKNERSLRILLADDSPDNCLLIRAYFKGLPWKIEIAKDGLVAVEKFKASAHDLVLMDVRMPEMDGLTATRVIRNWEKAQGLFATPIIALTASALAEDVARSLAAGCDAHLSKPVRKGTLIEAVRALASKTAEGIGGAVAPHDGPAGA